MRFVFLLICCSFLFPQAGICDTAAAPPEVSAPATPPCEASDPSTATVVPKTKTIETGPKPAVKRRGRTAEKRRGRCSGYAEPQYRRMVRNWQRAPKIPKNKYRDGFRDVTLYSVNTGERIRVFPYLSDGSIDPAVMEKIQHLMRDKNTDAEHSVHPRLIKLLYRIACRFDARQINIISGYREAVEDRNESKHSKGHAVDFMVPGVPLAAVAREARKLGRVGVGFYPSSGFVHLDVRGDGPSFFWVDRSGPGRGPCTRRILSGMASQMDRKWTPDKDEPKPERNRKGELLGATS